MAGKLLGRHKQPCISCGFEHVHVKSNPGKQPYLYCPECGLTVPTRNGKQAAGIMANMRPEKHPTAPKLQPGDTPSDPPQLERRADDINVPADLQVPDEPAPPPAAPAKKRGGWASTLLDKP
jgi:hypothetical protein